MLLQISLSASVPPPVEFSTASSDRRPTSGDKKLSSEGDKKTSSTPAAAASTRGVTGGATGGIQTQKPLQAPIRMRTSTSGSKEEPEGAEKGNKDSTPASKKPSTKAERRALQVYIAASDRCTVYTVIQGTEFQ